VLPVGGDVREEFSPLPYHVFAGYVAAYLVPLGDLSSGLRLPAR
jgi:hypothetical protein